MMSLSNLVDAWKLVKDKMKLTFHTDGIIQKSNIDLTANAFDKAEEEIIRIAFLLHKETGVEINSIYSNYFIDSGLIKWVCLTKKKVSEIYYRYKSDIGDVVVYFYTYDSFFNLSEKYWREILLLISEYNCIYWESIIDKIHKRINIKKLFNP